ncbi:hypothetical protein T484DRAFT_1848784 [Baffinella frigidus]|nr:hypothetical protein T484DRAFT_1848784 [Cryptophyta sp. CCMP2293]
MNKARTFENKFAEEEQEAAGLWKKARKATRDKLQAFKNMITWKNEEQIKAYDAHLNAPVPVGENTEEVLLRKRDVHIEGMATVDFKIPVFTKPNAEGMADFEEYGCNALECMTCKMHICRLCRQWTKCRGCISTLSKDMADVQKGIFKKDACVVCRADAHKHYVVCPHKQDMVDNGDEDVNDPGYYASQEEQDRIFLLNAQDRIRSDLRSLPLWSEKELYWKYLDHNPEQFKQGDMASYFGTPIPDDHRAYG